MMGDIVERYNATILALRQEVDRLLNEVERAEALAEVRERKAFEAGYREGASNHADYEYFRGVKDDEIEREMKFWQECEKRRATDPWLRQMEERFAAVDSTPPAKGWLNE
jgi:hypothetical protein